MILIHPLKNLASVANPAPFTLYYQFNVFISPQNGNNNIFLIDEEGAMSAIPPLCELLGVNPKKLTKYEYVLLEMELFMRICEEIKEIFRERYKNFFQLMKFTIEMENEMLEVNFSRLVIHDILSTEEYNLSGIAGYINSHEDVVQEVASGVNLDPSARFLQRIIGLHRLVHKELYQIIINKIIDKYKTLPDL